MAATYGSSIMGKGRFHLEQYNVLVPRAFLEPEQDFVFAIPKVFEKGYRLLYLPIGDPVPSFHFQFSLKGLAQNVRNKKTAHR
ncbi:MULTISPECIES: hypothetical protein [Maribacter]|uniref:Uncharacterized protein n=1 Tax=Maribacter flavus TaxID=1658664 RepID=A0ABU7IIZ2_9FLAO|nr:MULTISPECIES: hypothetical protein [Maribacter]MDC6405408.1 hypothetical protein [Maribacter sp. PR66]MEE1972824.1 hypothetical protein [Maribacter flavus]